MLGRLLTLVLDLRQEMRFAHESWGSLRGVFRDLDEARRAAPKTKPFGYDEEVMASDYAAELNANLEPKSYDWPVLFWLQRVLRPGHAVQDFGGNVGVHFYAYEPVLELPPGLTWTVCDVPAINAAGERIARERGRSELRFTEKVGAPADILIASGSLQYVSSLSALLDQMSDPPEHLFLNRTPMSDEGETFATLQNGGPVLYACYIFNRGDLIAEAERLGYRLVQEWIDDYDRAVIPFHRKRQFTYRGMYFRRRTSLLAV